MSRHPLLLPPIACIALALTMALSACATQDTPLLEDPDYRSASRAHLDGNHELAADLWRKWLDAHPGSPEAPGVRQRLGRCLLQCGHGAEARLAFRTALEQDPSLEVAALCWEGIGDADAAAGRHGDAAEAYQRALRTGGPSVERERVLLKRARALQRDGRFGEGERVLQEVAATAPDAPEGREAREALRDNHTHFAVQVGAYEESGHAREAVRRLRTQGHDAEVVSLVRDKGVLHAVRAGRFRDRASAVSLAASLRAAGWDGAFVVP